MSTHTRPCLCGQCGHDTYVDGGYSIPKAQDEIARRALLKSLHCDRFTQQTFNDFLFNETTRKSQRISKHHFTVAQLKPGQGGNLCLKPDAIADISLAEMVKSVKPVGVKQKRPPKRVSDESPQATPSSKRSATTPNIPDHPHAYMSPSEAAACDCHDHPNISPHPMPDFPTGTSSDLSAEYQEAQQVVERLKSRLAEAERLIAVLVHNEAQKDKLTEEMQQQLLAQKRELQRLGIDMENAIADISTMSRRQSRILNWI